MDWRVMLLIGVVLAGIGLLYFHGFQWQARFPNDWRYFIEVNLPSYSTDYPVVELNLPTTEWVRNGWLKPDCSDLRVTSDSNFTEVYPYAIVHDVPSGLIRLSEQRPGNTGSFTFYAPFKSKFKYLLRIGDHATYKITIKDKNTGEVVLDRGYFTSRYSNAYSEEIELEAGHFYEVNTETRPVISADARIRGVSSDPVYRVSGTVAAALDVGVIMVIEPEFGPGDNYCAFKDATVLVKVPPGTHGLRVWFGAQGDANYVAVPIDDVARSESLSLRVGAQGFANCSRYRSCGSDIHCWTDTSGRWSIFRYSKHFAGAGDEYWRGVSCHGKSFDSYYTYVCTDALNGGSDIVHAVASDRSGCCYRFVRESGSVSLVPDGNFYLYGLVADQLRIYNSPLIWVRVKGMGNIAYRGINITFPDWYWYCVGGKCFVPAFNELFYGRNGYYVATISWQHGEAYPDISFSAKVGYDDICGGNSGGVQVQNLRAIYLYSDDVIPVTVPASAQPSEYSVPPAIVLNGPDTVYWGQDATYEMTGSFESAKFIVEPFGEYSGSSLTVSWDHPGIYHLTAVAYNDKGTPSWIEKDINVVRRTLEVNLVPVDTPYVHEPFRAELHVTDVMGDPVDANVYVEGCGSCTVVGGQCTVTCTVDAYGPVSLSVSVDADDSYYVDYNGSVTVDVHRYDTEFRDVYSTVRNDNVVIEGYLWDTHHDAPVSGVPVHVTVYEDANVVASGTFYTLADGRFRVYLASTEAGTFDVDVSFDGDCNYTPAGPVSFVAEFRAPEHFEVNYPEVNVPVPEGAIVEGNTIILRETEVASPVLAEPVSVSPAGRLSVIPSGYASLGLFLLLGTLFVFVVGRGLLSL